MIFPVLSAKVCGTDGETYGNICELRANSANARVDYKGPCRESEPDEMVSRKCRRIRRSGNCPNITLCENLTQPEDGCCPICGKWSEGGYVGATG